MKRLNGRLLLASIVVGSVCFSNNAAAKDLCEVLNNHVLMVDANGYKGHTDLYNGIALQKQADGTYTFQAAIQFENEAADKVAGSCKDRHIVFTRTRPGAFVQKYDGRIFEKGAGDAVVKMAGTFDKNWGWCGETALTQPK